MDASTILHSKNARHVAVVAGLTAAVLLAGAGIHHLNANAEESNESAANEAAVADSVQTEQAAAAQGAKDVSKEETVHVALDAAGALQGVKSINVLKNSAGQAEVADESSLEEISTSAEDASFTQNGQAITWTAGEDDITYSGSCAADPPLALTATYKLDGKEISAEDLNGKSGEVSIRYSFANESDVPFLAASVFEFDDDAFSDIEVDGGTAMEGSDSTTVVGLAFPGLQDMLGVDASTFELSASFTVTATTSNFSLDTVNTIVTSSLFEDIDASNFENDAGSKDLNEGLDELKDAVDQAADGAAALESGASQLSSGIGQVASGAVALEAACGKAATGLKTATKTSKKAAEKLKALLAGSGLSAQQQQAAALYLAQIEGANSAVESVAGGLSGGNESLKSSLGALASSAGKLQSGAGQLQSGASQLEEGLRTLHAEGLDKLDDALTGEDSALAQLQDFPEKLEDLSAKAAGYETFSGKPANMDGSVMFIYQTAAIG